MICDVENCDLPLFVKKRGLCSLHYNRWRRHGDPLGGSSMRPNREVGYVENVERRRERQAAWYQANRDRVLAEQRDRLYGLAPGQFDAMRAAQSDSCAVCGALGPLVVDHCHASGTVRELLCNQCNRALGMFLDDPARLRAAANYVEKHRG